MSEQSTLSKLIVLVKFNSLQLLTDLLEQTEAILKNVVVKRQMYPTEILTYKQNENEWSAAQCLMHLNSYGRYYLPAIQTSIKKAANKKWFATETFQPGFVGNWFTELMKPKGEQQLIRKLKSPKEHRPVNNDNMDAVLAEFINQQETLLGLLEQAKSVNLKRNKTPISISRFIRLPLGDTFRFLIAHNERHILQAERSIAMATEKSTVL